MVEREIDGGLDVRSAGSSVAKRGWDRVAGAWLRSSGWSEIEWLERDRAWQSVLSLSELHRRRQSYVIVADGEHLGLVEEGRNRYRERTGTGRREREPESKREEKRKKWRERREKWEYKIINILQHLSVPLQICNGTVVMLYNLWDLAHLIKLQFYVWWGKCAKYLTFGTFTTPATDALKVAHLNLISNLTFTPLHNSTVVWIGMAHRPNFIFTSIEETWTDAKAFAGGVWKRGGTLSL